MIFNRPDETGRTFEVIRAAKPRKLYLSSDGPRDSRPGEATVVENLRKDLVSRIDWDCDVKTLFRTRNLGCKSAVSSGISWFFENESEGIILEDDCLPHPDFFVFCETMLKRYAHNDRVVHIGGTNFQDGLKRGDGDYYYSNLTHVWGWASWRRVWKDYDVEMKAWPEFKRRRGLDFLSKSSRVRWGLYRAFDLTYNGELDTWDYQLFFRNLLHQGVSLIPNSNLITNIGFTKEATHTLSESINANIPLKPLSGLNAPGNFEVSRAADEYTFEREKPQFVAFVKSWIFALLVKLRNKK